MLGGLGADSSGGGKEVAAFGVFEVEAGGRVGPHAQQMRVVIAFEVNQVGIHHHRGQGAGIAEIGGDHCSSGAIALFDGD